MSFLIVFLLYACYQPLRFSIEDPERQARYAAVFAIVGGAFVPLNFMAVRAAQSLVHPRTLEPRRQRCPARCARRSSLALVGMALLFVTLCKYELTAKHDAHAAASALKRRLAGEDDRPADPGRSRRAAEL